MSFNGNPNRNSHTLVYDRVIQLLQISLICSMLSCTDGLSCLSLKLNLISLSAD